MKYMNLTRQGLHAVDDLEIRADRDRIKAEIRSGSLSRMEEGFKKQELLIIEKEIKRRPMIPEDVFK